MAELHYTVKEVGALLHMGLKQVRQLFIKEPGVLVFSSGGRTTMRIPESVYERVLMRNAVNAAGRAPK